MDEWQEHVRQIEKSLLRDVIDGLDEKRFSDEELREVASFVLTKVDTTTNHEQLLLALEEMAKKWPAFSNVLAIEKGEIKEFSEDKVEDDVLHLAKSGKIEEAISLAKTSMQTK